MLTLVKLFNVLHMFCVIMISTHRRSQGLHNASHPSWENVFWLVQGHRASNWQNGDLNPVFLALNDEILEKEKQNLNKSPIDNTIITHMCCSLHFRGSTSLFLDLQCIAQKHLPPSWNPKRHIFSVSLLWRRSEQSTRNSWSG